MKKRWLLPMLLLSLLLCSTAHAAYWFGEEGGHRLHRDPYCSHRDVQLQEPFAYAVKIDSMQTLYASDMWTVCSNCYVSTMEEADAPLPSDFRQVFEATLEEKAAMLPGVWMLPRKRAISEEEARAIAVNYVAAVPAFAQYLNDENFQPRCLTSVFSYDACERDAFDHRATYKVLIMTEDMEDVGYVRVDALTGEMYGAVLLAGEE